MSLKMTEMDQDVKDVLTQSTVRENKLYLPANLERKLYLRTADAITALGGLWSRKEKAHIFDTPEAAEALLQAARDGAYVDPQDNGFWPTPEPLANEVIRLANLEPGLSVLEPSAGSGNLAARAAEITGWETVTCVELLPANVAILRAEHRLLTLEGDFLEVSPETFEPQDRVIMNPPFGNQVELDHVLHALRFLKPGGRLVAVMPQSLQFGRTKKRMAFWQEVRRVAANDQYEIIENPEGSFTASGTNVRTVTLVIDVRKESAVMENQEPEVQVEDVSQELDATLQEADAFFAEEGVPAPDETSQEPPKRKPGRPRKTAKAEAQPETAKPKRSRKQPEIVAEVISEEEYEAARLGIANLVSKAKVAQAQAQAQAQAPAPFRNGATPPAAVATTVSVESLILDERLQPRAAMDQKVVADYMERMVAGDIFPPVLVYNDGTLNRLADGWHRVAAVRQLGQEFISATVRPGGVSEALLASAGANADHGLRRSQADKRRAVVSLLTDPEHTRLTDGAIASVAKVSGRYVGMIRKALEESGAIEQATERVGKDGRTIAVTEIGRKLEQPKDPFKDVSDPEFDNADTPDAYTVAAEDGTIIAEVRTVDLNGHAEPEIVDQETGEVNPVLSAEELHALHAFDAVAQLLLFLDEQPDAIRRAAQRFRPEQLLLLEERQAEIGQWMTAVRLQALRAELMTAEPVES